jgi:6-phosphogluconate dehydrogenase
MNHIQGLALIQAASDRHQWGVDLKGLLRVWSGGCIIRSTLLEQVRKALAGQSPWLDAPALSRFIRTHWPPTQRAAAALVLSDQSYPVIQAGVDYFKYLTTARSTAYLLQAQRDYFGAHTYQRLDDPEGKAHHTEW